MEKGVLKEHYSTAFIPKYNILENVVQYYKEKKTNQANAQKAAAIAAFEAVIVAAAKANQLKK
jgi:hypothetical protein